MENHPVDQLFKDKLGNFEHNPPVGLLDKINQEIAFRSRVRRLNQFKMAISIAAALALILVAGWYTSNTTQIADNKIPVQAPLNIQPDQSRVVKDAVVSEKSANSLVAYQHASQQAVATHQGNAGSTSSVRKNRVHPASVKEQTAVASTKQEEVQKTVAEKPNTSVKEEAKSTSKPSQSQKKRDPLYFADSQFTSPTPDKKQVKGSWIIKAELSPMFAPQTQTGSTGSTTSTKSNNTISGGMIASYKLNKRLSISSGVRFSQMKQGTHSDYTLSATSGITYLTPVEKNANISRDVSLYLPSKSSIVYANGMNATSSNVFASDISQQFKYLEIPLLATYKLIDDKLSVGVTGGISTNILIGNVASITENGIKLSQGDTNNLRNVIYSGSAGVEVGYELSKRLVLTVEPRLKQYMHSVSSNDQVDFKPLQLGIFTGIAYSFN